VRSVDPGLPGQPAPDRLPRTRDAVRCRRSRRPPRCSHGVEHPSPPPRPRPPLRVFPV